MRNPRTATVERAPAEDEGASTERRPSTVAGAPVGLVALEVEEFDEEAGVVTLRHGLERVEAALDQALDPRVVKTALARRERLVAQRDHAGWVALGALRTAPTPGVDEGDEFVIRARRVEIAADHELAFVSGAASLVLRAHGYVETLAQDITTRATGLHKLVGRMLRLN